MESCLKGSYIEIDGDINEEVKFRNNEVGKMHEGIRKCFKCKSLSMSAKKKKLYEGILVPTALHGAETWNMGAAEKKI